MCFGSQYDASKVCLFAVKLPEDDLKQIETYRSISELHVIVYF